MKKYLLLLAALAVPTLVFTSCDNGGGGEDDPEYIYLVEKIENQGEGKRTTSFTYNSDYSLNSVNDGITTKSYSYDTEKRLVKVTELNIESNSINSETSFEYSGNDITANTTAFGNTYTVVYKLDNNSRVTEGIMTLNAADPLVQDVAQFEYDNKGRLIKYSPKTRYIDGVAQAPEMLDPKPISYKFDDKMAIIHEGVLPDWYFAAYSVIDYKLSPINNVTEQESEGSFGGGVTEYGLEYNEEGYPVEYAVLSNGEKNPASTNIITYRKVEVTK